MYKYNNKIKRERERERERERKKEREAKTSLANFIRKLLRFALFRTSIYI